MSCLAKSLRIRGVATAPNSPREIGAGVVWPRWIHNEGPSKSNVRHTWPAGLSGSGMDIATVYRSRRSPVDADINADADFRGDP